jgi:hypothetical protein
VAYGNEEQTHGSDSRLFGQPDLGDYPEYTEALGIRKALAGCFRERAQQVLQFYDAGDATEASVVYGIHLDEGQHHVLGEALAKAVSERVAF